MDKTSFEAKSPPTFLIAVAWGATLIASQLLEILFREISSAVPSWLYWVKLGVFIGFLLASLAWKRFNPLRLFAAVLLAVWVLGKGVEQFYFSINYFAWLRGSSNFVQSVGSVQIPRITEAILLVLVMLFLTRNRGRFFLAKGKLDAEAAPIPMIMTRPSSWKILGPAIAGAMMLGLIGFTLAFGDVPSKQSLNGLLPLLPFVLVFALTNSFGEEMLYRAPWLGALESPVGAMHALLMTSVYFGIAHFYGVPYGILGVVMSFIPGWLMGKSMIETRGIAWAWFIHFWMDVVIFMFIAMGSVTPGG